MLNQVSIGRGDHWSGRPRPHT